MRLSRVATVFIPAYLALMSSFAVADGGEIAVIVKTPYSTFWNNVQSGVGGAMSEFGDYSSSLQGPENEADVSQQVSLVEKAIDRHVSGIVLAPTDKNAFVPVLKKAFNSRIPVVLIESSIASTGKTYYQAMLSTDNYKAGEKAAEALIDKIGRNGKVVIISNSSDASAEVGRVKGFSDFIRNYSNLTIIGPLYSQSKIANALSHATKVLSANSDVRGMFCTDESTCIGMARAVANIGKSRGIVAIGFNGNPHLQKFVRDGILEGVVVQGSYDMGYLGAKTVIDVIEGRQVKPVIDTGAIYVTRDNISTLEVANNLF